MHYVRQHRAVHLFVLVPIGPMHVWNIEIVTFVAPHLIEDLFELFLGIEIHAQRVTHPSGVGLRRISIGIDDEQRRIRWSTSECARTSGATASATAAVNQLVTVGADVERGDSAYESGCPPFAQAIASQFVTRAAKTAATSCALRARRFQIEHCSVRASDQ